MDEAKKKIGRPKSADPRLFFACRLRKATIDKIKAMAKDHGISEGAMVEMAFQSNLYVVSTDHITAEDRRRLVNPFPTAPMEIMAATGQRHGAGGSLAKPNGKLL